MTKKIFALLMAFAMVISLAACGGNADSKADNKTNSAVSDSAGSNSSDSAADSTPDAPVDDTKEEQNPGADSESADNESAEPEQETAAMALNRIDFTLKNVGDSFQLEVENLSEGASVIWSISDESVATIAEDGTVTAVAHGTATATAAVGDVALGCIVRVSAKAEETEGGSQSGGTLNAFYESTIGKYEMPMMMLLEDEELLNNFFPGLTAVKCSQRGVYFNMMSVNNGEMAMAEAANSADVEAIKAAFQARVDYMIDNSMFYAESNEIWTNQSRVVSVGNYVLMVASPHCDSIVDDFKAFAG